MADTNLARFRIAVAGALAHLESRRREINDLNVFPVADGDTGDNMAVTLRAVLDELDRLMAGHGESTIDEIGREEIVQSVARAALLGARGNSGVILSQLIRGAAEELVSRPGELIDPTLIAAALAHAADRGYASVREPAEGTILTVAREMAHQIMTDVAHRTDSPRLGPATDPALQDEVIAQTLERALTAGRESVDRGPELLAVLRDAGVVDAGGYGLTVLFAGVVAALRGEESPHDEQAPRQAPARGSRPEHSSITYRYCTNFAVIGEGLEAAGFTGALEAIGDSVLVVGDAATLKVHVHTDDPERATAVFAGVGAVSRLDVADMRAPVAERDTRRAAVAAQRGEQRAAAGAGPAGTATSAGAATSAAEAIRARCGAVAVVCGDGMHELFASFLACNAIDGGLAMDPSASQLLAAIHGVPCEEVVVLPNGPAAALTAQHCAELSEKRVSVVPAMSQQAGLAAAVVLRSDLGAHANATALTSALEDLRSGSVAQAASDDPDGRFRRGEAIGLVDDRVVAWGEVEPTLRFVLTELSAGAELISCIAGRDAPLDELEVARLGPEGVSELEHRRGEPPHRTGGYWWPNRSPRHGDSACARRPTRRRRRSYSPLADRPGRCSADREPSPRITFKARGAWCTALGSGGAARREGQRRDGEGERGDARHPTEIMRNTAKTSGPAVIINRCRRVPQRRPPARPCTRSTRASLGPPAS